MCGWEQGTRYLWLPVSLTASVVLIYSQDSALYLILTFPVSEEGTENYICQSHGEY